MLPQEEFEIAYQEAKAAGLEPNGVVDEDPDANPEKISVARWVMENSHCGWLIGKGGSGIRDIEVCNFMCAPGWCVRGAIGVCGLFGAREPHAIAASQHKYGTTIVFTVRAAVCIRADRFDACQALAHPLPSFAKVPVVYPLTIRNETKQQASSGAQVRVATERSLGKDALGKDSGERIVYVKGNKAQREAALDMIRSNPKVGGWRAGSWGGDLFRAAAAAVRSTTSQERNRWRYAVERRRSGSRSLGRV